jgi:putative DNA primase/helicase
LLGAIADRQCIAVTEGERCAEMLSDLEIPATTNAGGAGKWKPELNPFFAGADLILIPDNDDAGHKHMQGVGAALIPILGTKATSGDVCFAALSEHERT